MTTQQDPMGHDLHSKLQCSEVQAARHQGLIHHQPLYMHNHDICTACKITENTEKYTANKSQRLTYTRVQATPPHTQLPSTHMCEHSQTKETIPPWRCQTPAVHATSPYNSAPSLVSTALQNYSLFPALPVKHSDKMSRELRVTPQLTR